MTCRPLAGGAHFNRLMALGALLAAALSSPVLGQGGAIVLYENGSPDMGSSYAGAGAQAEDAATAFQNPAGLTRLKENQVLLGSFGILIDMELDLSAPGTISDPPGSLEGGGQIGGFSPALGMFAAIPINDAWTIGFTVNALAATGVDYDPDWVGRTFVTESDFLVANIMPSVGYRINEWLSLGAGLNVVYGSLDQQLKANSTPTSPTIQIDEADDWAFAGTFGVLLEPSETTRVGITYRTEIELNLSGDIQSPLPADVAFGSDMTLPQGINVGLYHELNDQWALLADAGWSDWSAFSRIPTTIGPVTVDVDRDWHDTWRGAIGFEYRFVEDWLFRGGFSYDSSPVDADDLLPDIPVGDQYRFSVGIQHDFGEGKVFAFTYTFMYSDIDVDNVALPPDGTVVLDGDFDDSFIHILGGSLSISF